MALSTYLTEEDISIIVQLSGAEIRSFLKAALHQEENHYSPDIPTIKDKLEHLISSLHDFATDPAEFSDEALVQKGANIEIAYQYPIRIEVRRIPNILEASPQIAARGIMDICRHKALQIFAEHNYFKEKKIHFKMSGGMSFEFNREGVEKSLPLKYLQHYWDRILTTIGYQSRQFNAQEQKSLIVMDGDGTLFGKPQTDHLPTLKESKAYKAFLNYLELGGLFLLISGNEFGRTIKRFAPFVPKQYHGQVLLAANGGANLATFQDGEMKEYHTYSETALEHKNLIRNQSFNFLYFGDDSKKLGNDYQAFDFVGFDHGISVDSENTHIAQVLQNQWIGKNEEGVEKILAKINQFLETSVRLPLSQELTTMIQESR